MTAVSALLARDARDESADAGGPLDPSLGGHL